MGWTKGVWDTAKPGVEAIVRRTTGGFRPGGILLLHDADGSGDGDDRSQTVEAVPEIVERAHAAGYELVTVSELATKAPPKRTATWRIVAGLVLFGILLELALRTVDLSTVSEIDIAWWWVGASLALNLASILLKAVVWKAALDTIPDHPRFHYAHVVPALFVGFLLNTLLPARLGEIGRVAVLQRRLRLEGTDVPNATLAGSLVAEQIVLAIALVAIMLLQLPFVNVPARFENMILAFGGVVIVVLLAVIGLEAFSRRSRGSLTCAPTCAFARGQQALAMLHPIARGMQQGQTVLRRPRTAAFALLAGLASWAAQIGGIYAALAAADIHPTIGTAGLVFLVSTLVQLFPFWPGNVGLFQAAVAQVLVQAYPIDFPHALAFAVGLQVIEVCARRRARLLVPLARGPLAVRGARPARRRLGSEQRDGRCGSSVTRAPARRYGVRGGHVPPRGGAIRHIRVDMQKRWDGSPRLRAARTASLVLAADSRCSPGCTSPPTPPGTRPDRRRRRRSRARSSPPPGCRSAGTRPSARRATTCGWPATARFTSQHADAARCAAPRRSLLLRAGPLVLEGARGRQAQLALVEHPRRSSCGRSGDRVPADAPDRAACDRGRREQHHRHVRRLEGRSRASPATSCWRAARCSPAASPHRSPRRASPARRSSSARARPRRRRPRVAALARRATRGRAPAPTTSRRPRPRTCGRSRSPTRASRWPGIPRVDPDGTVRRYAVYRNGVLLGHAARHRLPRAQPRARHAVPLHGRGDRRRRAPLARERARHGDAGSAARDRARPTRTCSPRPARASRTCSATTARSRSISPTYYHLGRDLAIRARTIPS